MFFCYKPSKTSIFSRFSFQKFFTYFFPKHPKNSRPRAVQNDKFELQKAAGQDLAQKGRFGSFPQEKFNTRPRAVKNDKFELQKAPGQDLAQSGRFGSFLEERFNCRPRAVQSDKFELPKVPGQDSLVVVKRLQTYPCYFFLSILFQD